LGRLLDSLASPVWTSDDAAHEVDKVILFVDDPLCEA
jgi:hypothetical protein